MRKLAHWDAFESFKRDLMMAFNETTVAEAVRAINENKYVLPAIQREFVWSADRIGRLFDSLMQGYPIGQLLFWQIEASNSHAYRYYGFMRDYHERDNIHCPELPTQHDRELTGVLDGQQRLTALSIGLQGSMATKKPRHRWNNDRAFPRQTLHLNLTGTEIPDAEEADYDFRFLEAADRPDGLWFPVRQIMSMETGVPMLTWLQQQELKEQDLNKAFGRLTKLHEVIHTRKPLAFFVEKSQNLDRVLQIFIRINSKGIALSYSDLLLSIATAQWSGKDARKEVHSLVDDMNNVDPGFEFSKDFVLKAGLMLLDISSVGFKVENFDRKNMARIEEKWDDVRDALMLTVRLIASMGFDSKSLRADSALLPIAYYIFQRRPGESYLTAETSQQDRALIKSWLVRSFLKASGIWGSGLDALLTALREQIRQSDMTSFPIESIEREMARRGRSLAFTDEEVDDLAAIKYGDKRAFPLLTLLYDFVDTRNHFHVDHVYPRSKFTPAKLKREGIDGEKAEELHGLIDRLPNLQLLEGHPNIEKGSRFPAGWLMERFSDEIVRQDYMDRHNLRMPSDSGQNWHEVGHDVHSFENFYHLRRQLLEARIRKKLHAPSLDDEKQPEAA